MQRGHDNNANGSKLSKQIVEAKLDPRTKRMRSKQCEGRKLTKVKKKL
jgi:hypothetical protein